MDHGGRSSLSLRCLVGIVIAAVALPTLALAVGMMIRFAAAEHRAGDERNLGIARAVGAQLDRQLANFETALLALASGPELAQRDFAALYRHAAAVARQHDARIILAGVDGGEILNTRLPFGQPLTRSPGLWMPGMIAKPAATVSDLFRGKATGDYLVSVRVPIVEKGRLAMAIAMAIRPELLSRLLADQPLPTPWTMTIADRSGHIVARSRDAAGFLGRPIAAELRRAMAARQEGLATVHDRAGAEIYTAFAHSRLSGWSIVFAIPRDVVDAPLRSSTAATAIGGLALLMIGAAVALVVLHWIGRSMRAVSAAAIALGDGKPLPPVTAGIREVDRVIQAIAAAAGSLDRRSEERDRAEARLHDFIETGSHWYWETDAAHRFTYLSEDIRSFGHAPPKLIGHGRWEYAADLDSDPEKWRAHLAALDRHEPFREFVYTRRTDGEGERTSSVSGKPVFDGRGAFLGYRGSARDVTEEVEAARDLREAKLAAETANRAKSQFLANMSHELRTPLNAILGFSEMLQLEVAGPLQPRQREYIGLIRQSGGHLLDVITEILDLAKVDAGKLELHDGNDIDPNSLAEACIAWVKGHANAVSLDLRLVAQPGLPPLRADETRLKQILLNLLSNAVKFTAPGGTVILATRRSQDGGIEFVVRDTGPGMTSGEIAIALEPFGQVDSGVARRHEGTGLGLPLARRLVELHGGKLRIDSEKGSGTTIIVSLPVARVSAAEPLAAAAE